MDKSEDKEIRRAMEGRTRKRKRRDNYEVTVPDDEGSQDGEIAADGTLQAACLAGLKDLNEPKENAIFEFMTSTSAEPSLAVKGVGIALQRNVEGTVIAPRVRQKREDKKVHSSVSLCDQTSVYPL